MDVPEGIETTVKISFSLILSLKLLLLFKITDFRDRVRYLELIKLVHNSQNLNESILNEYVVPFKDINIFNSVMMNFTINRFKTKINNTQQYNSPFLNSILSVYIQQLITDEEFNNYLNSNNPSDTSYTMLVRPLSDYLLPFLHLK